MRKNIVFILLLSSIVGGCNRLSVFDQYKTIKNNEWHRNQPVEFSYNNTDSISRNNIFLNIRNNKEYPFSTIFLISKITFPNKKKIIDTLQYEMADNKGKWLGTGFFSIKENKLFYKENVIFPKKGVYKFSIQHATRGFDDVEGNKPLLGILNVGLQIEKIKK